MISNWDDIRLFLAVTRAGGLARAESETGLSSATLGRRITALERELSLRLFERGRDGYQLTLDGREFFDRALHFEAAAGSIESWCTQNDAPELRVSAGDFTTQYLLRHIGDLLSCIAPARLRLISTVDYFDLQRREVHFAVRNQRPTQPGLCMKRLRSVDFALFASHDFVARQPEALAERCFESCDFIVFDKEVPSTRWLRTKLERAPQLCCSSSRHVLDATSRGAGIAILPRFIADEIEELTPVSDSIPELAHHQWLVSHDEDRHLPLYRDLSAQLAQLLQ